MPIFSTVFSCANFSIHRSPGTVLELQGVQPPFRAANDPGKCTFVLLCRLKRTFFLIIPRRSDVDNARFAVHRSQARYLWLGSGALLLVARGASHCRNESAQRVQSGMPNGVDCGGQMKGTTHEPPLRDLSGNQRLPVIEMHRERRPQIRQERFTPILKSSRR